MMRVWCAVLLCLSTLAIASESTRITLMNETGHALMLESRICARDGNWCELSEGQVVGGRVSHNQLFFSVAPPMELTISRAYFRVGKTMVTLKENCVVRSGINEIRLRRLGMDTIVCDYSVS